MTKVTGKLFDDGRDGFLIVKPSKPFFGCNKHEKRFPINEGEVDIELTPTPPGIQYLVAFKEPGDFTRTDFTLRWRVPNVQELDISPAKPKPQVETPSPGSVSEQVQVKRLATELASTLKQVAELEHQLRQNQLRFDDINSKFSTYKVSSEKSLSYRDAAITDLRDSSEPEVRTVYKEVSVPSAPLKQRIQFLEGELERLNDLNNEYYQSVVELHQLKLERAQSLPSPGPISSPEDSPRQRLINKLFSR